jgi:CRISPR-associated endonuclease Cas2
MSVYQVCYDISDAKRRRRVVRILEGHGYRVQRSVFLVYGDRATVEGIMARIGKVLAPADACLATCLERRSTPLQLGPGEVRLEPEKVVVL